MGYPRGPWGVPPGVPPAHPVAIASQGKGLSKIFFALYRPNFDDLRPLKAKIGTFEHLWGSKTWFCAADFSWFFYQRQVDF